MPTTPPAAPALASLPVPRAGDRAVWSAPVLDEPTLRGLRDRAEADRGAPWPVPTAKGFARYLRDGDRAEYEDVVFGREYRLTRAAVLAAVTLDETWIDEVVDGVVLTCEQSTWSLPAHDDCFQRGAAVTDVTRPYLDLRAGDVAGQLAWIDHLLGEQLDARAPGVRARIRYEVDRRVLTPFVTRRDWHWLHNVHNWSAWIHGNVLVAALALVEDEAARAKVVDLAVEGLERYVASLPEDGAIDEGFMYWWQGACRALEAFDILGLSPARLREVVSFPHRMHLGADWYLNFADGAARLTSDELPWCALHQAARRFEDADALAHAAAQRQPGAPVAREEQGLGRLLRALTDPRWVDAGRARSPLPRDVWLPSTQVLLARAESGTAAGLTLAIKGGHNDEHHNHNDVGTVIVALNGVPVIVDPGRPTYTAQTFGPDRYEIWTMQSSWHSVPEIRGTAQAAGPRFAARDVERHEDDHSSGLTLDLAAAYPRDDCTRWEREARLDRRDGRVHVTERWQSQPDVAAPGPEAPTRIHLILAGTVEVAEGHAKVTAIEGAGALTIAWDPAHAHATATTRPLDDPWLTRVWGDRLTRLEIDVTLLDPAGALTWTVAADR